MFKKKAVFIVEKETFDDEDALMEIVLDAGAEDMKAEDEVFEITAEPDAFDEIEKALGEKGIETASAEVTMVPDTTVHLAGKDARRCRTSSTHSKRTTMSRTFTATTSRTTKSNRHPRRACCKQAFEASSTFERFERFDL